MFLKLTTIDGPAIINLSDVHAIVPFVEDGGESEGSDLWWKDGIKDPVSSGIGERARTTYVEETLDEILALLAGGHE
jgi:hypothetical protein